ncbi:MAG: hypothetical protein SFV15_09760 [Polyangiaceae bacterium]|nr:hypothetical protein [Polyangiaceae bacterium]
MLYVFVLICGLLGAGAYLIFFLSQVPGAAEDRLGVYEELPSELGKWKLETGTPEALEAEANGRLREVRWFFEEAALGGGGKLIQQVRFVDPKSREVLEVLPEIVIKRRRTKKKA